MALSKQVWIGSYLFFLTLMQHGGALHYDRRVKSSS